MTANRTAGIVKLRSTANGAKLRVDHDAGTIKGVALASEGEAKGHGFRLDAVSLRQMAELINAKGSVPMRLSHPGGEAVFFLIGTVTNARVEGNTLRGDLTIGEFARNVPGKGDVRSFLLGIADEEPTLIGMSAVLYYRPEEQSAAGLPVARVLGIEAVDVVADPAACRHGLLGAPKPKNQKGKLAVNEATKQYLIDNYNLSPDVSDDAAQAFYDALSPEAKSEIVSDHSKPATSYHFKNRHFEKGSFALRSTVSGRKEHGVWQIDSRWRYISQFSHWPGWAGPIGGSRRNWP